MVTIEGEGLQQASAALERSDIHPRDPDVGWFTAGAEVVSPRIVASVEADSAEEVEARVREVLPQSSYEVTVERSS